MADQEDNTLTQQPPEESMTPPAETPTETPSEAPEPPAETPQEQPDQVTPDPEIGGSDNPPAPPVSASATAEPKKSKSWLVAVLVIILVLIAAAAIAYFYRKPANKAATTVTKKDIPLINYGLSDGNLSALYPLGDSNTSAMYQVNTQLFEGLVSFQNQTKISPLLATNWYNPDNSSWVFNLRHGVKFNDGKPMTAQDVKNSLDYAVAHQNDPNPASILSIASSIKEVDVKSPYQVKIVTNGPDPTLLNRLAQLFVFDTKAKPGDPKSGTGPYVVKAGTTPTASNIDLVASNNYWGGHVYTREVRISTVLDPSKLGDETAQGQFDIAGDMPDSSLAKLHASQVLSVQDLGISFLGVNTENAKSPLSSLAARQAVAYALDIPAILKASNTRGQQASQLIPSTIPGHDPSIIDTKYNPDKAKQLLSTVKNASTPITLTYPTGDDTKANEIAKELTAVGFNVKLSKVPDVNTEVGIAFGGQTDLFYLSYTSNLLDGLDIFNSIVVGNSDYNNNQVSNLANQAGSTLDPAARIKLLQQISQQVAKDIPDVPLFTQTRNYAVMKPYHVQVDLPSTEAGLYFWQVYQ